ncbi:MAG: flagellar biosynthetic protein FliO [Spirochaetales bacterium]|nr:flagellar biosynthetic protein FliO [Spirochaetales bacterium]
MKRDPFVKIFILFFCFQALLGAQETDSSIANAQALPDENTILIEDTENPIADLTPGGTAVTAWDVIRMILILAGVLILIYAIFHFMRKAGGAKYQPNNLIDLHASLGLGGDKSVHLIETGQEFFLVGAAENGVNLISKIDNKDAVDDIRFKISTSETPLEPRNFADIFSRLIKRGDSDVNLGKSMSKNKDFMKEQRERLKKM